MQNDNEYTVHAWWADNKPDASEGWDLQLPGDCLHDTQVDPRSVTPDWLVAPPVTDFNIQGTKTVCTSEDVLASQVHRQSPRQRLGGRVWMCCACRRSCSSPYGVS